MSHIASHYVVVVYLTLIITIFVGGFVFLKSPKHQLNKVFLFYSFSIGIWAFFSATHTFVSHDVSLLFAKLMHVDVPWIAVLFFQFVLIFLGEEKNPKMARQLLIAYLIAICLGLLALATDWIVARVHPQLGFAMFMDAGPLYYLIPVFFLIYACLSLALIYRAMKKSLRVRKRHLELLFWGSFLGYSLGFTNFLPVYDFIPFPYPYGSLGIITYYLIMAYAIVRYRFMGIQLTSADKEKLKTMLAVSGSINHEIRNPLGFIMADSQDALKVLETMPEHNAKGQLREILEKIGAHAGHTIEVTKTMTRFARPVKDKTEFAAVDIRECAEAAVRQFREGMEGSEKISVEITSECCEGEKVLGDTVFIRESLRNFLENAAYGIRQANREEGTISIRISPVGRKRIAVSVTDNGCGIPKEDLTRVFDMDYSTRKDGFKHGAGMFLVKWYADQMKAELNIESTEGVGTTVHLSLPRGK